MAPDGKAHSQMSAPSIPLRSTFAERRARVSVVKTLMFAAECALGVIAVVLIGLVAHWLQWRFPVSVLLYLLVVVPTALWCGFWQAVVVPLSAVAVQGYFNSRVVSTNPAADPVNSIELLAFILTALVISRLSARVTEHARESDSWGGQMEDLYEFTRRTLQM